jgi:3alpha(or 20beta)-hydroxysteroid dehydrogenase
VGGRLSGAVAIVTGAARGQGEAEARLFAQEGAQVVLGDILDDLGAAVAADIGSAARYLHHDVRSESDWKSMCDYVVDTFGVLPFWSTTRACCRSTPCWRHRSMNIGLWSRQIKLVASWE